MNRKLITILCVLGLLAASLPLMTGCREKGPNKNKDLSVYTMNCTISFTKTLPDRTTSQAEVVLLKDHPLDRRGFGSTEGVDFVIEYNRHTMSFGIWISNGIEHPDQYNFEMSDAALTITVSDGTTHTVTVGSGRLGHGGSECFSIPSPRLMD